MASPSPRAGSSALAGPVAGALLIPVGLLRLLGPVVAFDRAYDQMPRGRDR